MTPGSRSARSAATRRRARRRARRFSRARPAADGDAGSLVARRRPLCRRRAGPPCACGAPARTPGHRHARRRARRGHSRRLRRGLLGAACARDARDLPARLLRRGTRRRAVRPRRRGRAAARAAAARGRGAGAARARGRRSRATVRRRVAVAEACRRPRRARCRRARRAARRRAGAFVERGGRSLVPLREPEEDWLRVALAALVAHVKRGGAKRLAVERFDGEPVIELDRHAAACRSRLPRRPAPRRVASALSSSTSGDHVPGALFFSAVGERRTCAEHVPLHDASHMALTQSRAPSLNGDSHR